MAFSKMQEDVKEGQAFQGGIYKVFYDEKIKQFQKLCIQHGLGTGPWLQECKWCGVRLYTTDDTTATDNFNIQYQDNFFQDIANKLSNISQSMKQLTQFRGITRSATGRDQEIMDRIGQKANQVVVDKLKKSGASEEVIGNVGSLLSSVKDLLKGNRISFPKIWQNTTSSNSLNAVVKLVSPYGSPEAVRQFIIKPLMFLIILASPQTDDGISYGNVIPLTIKAYGINYTVLGSISNITLRRGGQDTSFNIYRQPLTIDVSIEFQTLFDGFAIYTLSEDEYKQNPDHHIFTNPSLVNPDYPIIDKTSKTPLLTMGTLLESLKPVQLVEADFQIYGNFLRPAKNGISNPGMSTSSLSAGTQVSPTNRSSFDPLSAVLDTAKNSVKNIGSSVNSWVSTAKTSASNIVRDKVKLNLKEFGRL
jgi:hypothetical protein